MSTPLKRIWPATAAHGSQRALLLISLAVAGGLAGDEERVIARQWELAALTEVGGEFVRRIYSARWLWALGLGAWRRGDLDRAAELQQESLRLRADLNDRMDNAHCVEALAWIAASAHHYERAAVLLGAAASRWQSMGMTLDGYQQPGHLGCLHAAPRRQRTGRADYSTAVRASSPLCDDGSSTRAGGSPPEIITAM